MQNDLRILFIQSLVGTELEDSEENQKQKKLNNYLNSTSDTPQRSTPEKALISTELDDGEDNH